MVKLGELLGPSRRPNPAQALERAPLDTQHMATLLSSVAQGREPDKELKRLKRGVKYMEEQVRNLEDQNKKLLDQWESIEKATQHGPPSLPMEPLSAELEEPAATGRVDRAANPSVRHISKKAGTRLHRMQRGLGMASTSTPRPARASSLELTSAAHRHWTPTSDPADTRDCAQSAPWDKLSIHTLPQQLAEPVGCTKSQQVLEEPHTVHLEPAVDWFMDNALLISRVKASQRQDTHRGCGLKDTRWHEY